jgi:hypothetical protein
VPQAVLAFGEAESSWQVQLETVVHIFRGQAGEEPIFALRALSERHRFGKSCTNSQEGAMYSNGGKLYSTVCSASMQQSASQQAGTVSRFALGCLKKCQQECSARALHGLRLRHGSICEER